MEDSLTILGLFLLGVFGFIFSSIIEASGLLYEVFRWGAVVFPCVLAGWKIIEKIRKKEK